VPVSQSAAQARQSDGVAARPPWPSASAISAIGATTDQEHPERDPPEHRAAGRATSSCER
jgi:hypothetical protein